jgi:hypothetical protein
MNTDSVFLEWLHATGRVARMWARGWLVLAKSLLAYFIITVFASPLGWFASILARSPEPRSLWTIILCCLAGLICFPLIVYVAASWVGFCRYVAPSET